MNDDGCVTLIDVLLVTLQIGAREGDRRYDARYGLDGNGIIWIPDLLIVVKQYADRC